MRRIAMPTRAPGSLQTCKGPTTLCLYALISAVNILSMHTIKWGIIGCGDVTEVKSGPAFSKVPGSALVAVMRRNADKARDYALRRGVPRWYSDAAALINDGEVNAVYVATPPLH